MKARRERPPRWRRRRGQPDLRVITFFSSPVTRVRGTYVAAALTTIVLGLMVQVRGAVLGPVARDVAGDALWAAMMVWWIGALTPNVKLAVRAVAAYAICASVEASQLHHAPTLDAIRAMPLGHLVLGSGFDPWDLATYALGVAGAVLVETAVRRAGSET